MRKIISLTILLLMLCLVMAACNKEIIEKPDGPDLIPFTIEAGIKIFARNNDYPMHTSMSDAITLGKYNVESLDMGSGLIVLSTDRLVDSQFDKRYLVKNLSGEDVISLTDNMDDDIITLLIDNNIIITTDQYSKTTIYDLTGKELLTDITCNSAQSVGDYHFRVNYPDNRSQVYANNGTPLFYNLESYPFASNNIFSQGEDYIIVKTNQGHNEIFNNSGYLVKAYYSSEQLKYRVEYLGNSRFLIIEDNTVTANDNYDIKLDDKYLKQNTRLYYADKNKELTLDHIDVIYDFANQYTILNLKNEINYGFSYIKVYNLNDDRTINSSKPYNDIIIDSNANYCLRFAEDVFPFVLFKEDKGIEQKFLTSIRMIALDGSVIWSDNEYLNIVSGHNDGMIITGKSIDNKLLYGAVDIDGNRVIEHQYDTLSPFTGGYAIASLDNVYYRIDKDNQRENINKEVASVTNYGIYIVNENDLSLLYNNEGTCFVGADKEAKTISIYSDNLANTYIITKDNLDNLKLYKLN